MTDFVIVQAKNAFSTDRTWWQWPIYAIILKEHVCGLPIVYKCNKQQYRQYSPSTIVQCNTIKFGELHVKSVYQSLFVTCLEAEMIRLTLRRCIALEPRLYRSSANCRAFFRPGSDSCSRTGEPGGPIRGRSRSSPSPSTPARARATVTRQSRSIVSVPGCHRAKGLRSRPRWVKYWDVCFPGKEKESMRSFVQSLYKRSACCCQTDGNPQAGGGGASSLMGRG